METPAWHNLSTCLTTLLTRRGSETIPDVILPQPWIHLSLPLHTFPLSCNPAWPSHTALPFLIFSCSTTGPHMLSLDPQKQQLRMTFSIRLHLLFYGMKPYCCLLIVTCLLNLSSTTVSHRLIVWLIWGDKLSHVLFVFHWLTDVSKCPECVSAVENTALWCKFIQRPAAVSGWCCNTSLKLLMSSPFWIIGTVGSHKSRRARALVWVRGFLVIMDMHVLKCTQVPLDIERLGTLGGRHANR